MIDFYLGQRQENTIKVTRPTYFHLTQDCKIAHNEQFESHL